jgi:hypothetical protein
VPSSADPHRDAGAGAAIGAQALAPGVTRVLDDPAAVRSRAETVRVVALREHAWGAGTGVRHALAS